VKKILGKENKFRKDFTPEQYLAYLIKKGKNPIALIPEDNEPTNTKLKSKKKST
jgi:hypothetical protein